MLGHKRALLKTLINKQFAQGINKVDLFNALEKFINDQYPEKLSSVYLTKNSKNDILSELARDIKNAGGLDLWKKKILMLGAPIVGSLPPKRKKKD